MPKLQNNIVSAIMGINLSPNYASLISDLVQSDNPFSRENSLAHITASGLVIDSKKVLLIFHPYIKRWFQPGGHIDPNENPSEAAIREVWEETGYVCKLDRENASPIHIDIHQIPENPIKNEPGHLHVDLMYKLDVIERDASSEDILYQWIEFGEVKNERLDIVLKKLRSQHL